MKRKIKEAVYITTKDAVSYAICSITNNKVWCETRYITFDVTDDCTDTATYNGIYRALKNE
jgi:hypothetical protein